jgi:hypothetical protein
LLLLASANAVTVLGHENAGHWDEPQDNCSEGVNYMPPFKDGSVLDPCDDGECWTYCDHMEWHDTSFNASEFSQDHLLEEQYECLATACTNFFYGHVNLQVLEECAHYKCLVSQPNILDSRPCALTLLYGSSIYALIEKHKLQFDRWAKGNRSLVEYGKHHFMYRVNTILDEQHSSIWNLELTVHDMNTVLEIKDPVAENDMIVKILGGLDDSVKDSEMIGIHIENATLHTVEIRDRLWVIFYQTKVVATFAGALAAVKEYLDQVRRDVIRSYVYNGTVCTPPEVMIADIEENCDICSNGKCHFNSTDIYFDCTCDLGWAGDYCDRPMTSCTDEPCINAGACFNEFDTFRCECPSTWVGRYCEISVDETAGCVSTDAAPCQNGAVCTDYPMSYQCECSFGWMGRNCQYALRDCSQVNPCDHGECMFNGTRLQCLCPVEPTYQQPFWSGDTCSIQQRECDYVPTELEKWSLINGSPCSGHGLCTLDETTTGWTCLCASSHIGLRCSIPIDDANQCVLYGVDCVHGSCDHCENKNNCECECDVGFEGEGDHVKEVVIDGPFQGLQSNHVSFTLDSVDTLVAVSPNKHPCNIGCLKTVLLQHFPLIPCINSRFDVGQHGLGKENASYQRLSLFTSVYHGKHMGLRPVVPNLHTLSVSCWSVRQPGCARGHDQFDLQSVLKSCLEHISEPCSLLRVKLSKALEGWQGQILVEVCHGAVAVPHTNHTVG